MVNTVNQHSDATATPLVEFMRKNSKTGANELLRIGAWDANGRISVGLRLFYKIRTTNPDDDGWRPDKEHGLSIPETNLDAVIESLEEARRMVHAQGRSTSGGNATQSRQNPRQPAQDRLVTNLPARYQRSGSPRPETGDRNSAPWKSVGDDVF